jgi:hypothetical protein
METPLLYRQLQDQLRQWIRPKDQRHLQGFSKIVAAILQSKSACFGKWITYLRHRGCQARAHMERLIYFLLVMSLQQQLCALLKHRIRINELLSQSSCHFTGLQFRLLDLCIEESAQLAERKRFSSYPVGCLSDNFG